MEIKSIRCVTASNYLASGVFKAVNLHFVFVGGLFIRSGHKMKSLTNTQTVFHYL
jgi:hypothetical protein